MRKIYTLTLLAFTLLAGVSCSKNASTEPANPKTEVLQLPQHTATISLSATFSPGVEESPRAYLRPTDAGTIKVEFKDEELMKNGTTLDASGKPVRVLNTETGKLTLFFVEKSNLSQVFTKVVDPTDFRKTDDGKYVMTFHGDIVLPGLDMNSGEWYISGGYRLDEAGNKTGNISGFTYLDADGKLHTTTARGNVTDFKVPYVFGWAKLSTKHDNGALASNFGQNRNLDMIPDGYFFRVRAINNLVEDIDLTFLAILREKIGVSGYELTGFNYTASVNSEAELVSTNRPRLATTTDAKTGSLKDVSIDASLTQSRYALGTEKTSEVKNLSSEGVGLVLASGDYYPLYQRINSPTDVSNVPDASGMVFHFNTKDRALGTDVRGNMLDSRERVGFSATSPVLTWPQSGPVLTDDWRGGTMFESTHNNRNQFIGRGFRNEVLPANKTFERGKINNINFKITSDLMITELYTTRYSDRKGSFGLIEIYNPTLDEIDLSKYALLRIGYRHDSGTNKIRVVPATEEASQTSTYKIGVNPIGSGYFVLQNISKALLLPLDMINGEPSGKWVNNSFANQLTSSLVTADYRHRYTLRYTGPVATPVQYSGFSANVVDFSTKSYITGLESITAGSTKLKPGKTMIVLFSGFASSSYRPTNEDNAIFRRIQSAVTAGYCQYVVAIGQGATSAEPHTAGAGVTTADLGDSFSLVKIANLPIGGFNPQNYRNRLEQRICVDGTWTPAVFDADNAVVGNLMAQSTVKAILRRPFAPYLWNNGFLPPSDMSSYYQVAYIGAEQATFGAPYFSSYDMGKDWNSVVAPKIAKRNASLFKKTK